MDKMELISQSEQLFLGCILLEPDLLEETDIKPSQLVFQEHSNVYNHIGALAKKGYDVTLVNLARLGKTKLESFGGLQYLQDIMTSVASTHAFRQHEKTIKDYHNSKKVEEYCHNFINRSVETFNSEDLRDFVDKVNQVEDSTTVSHASFADMLKERYEEHLNSPTKGLSGIDTGFSNLNGMTDGWQENDLIIIGARPSIGKTAFILNSMMIASKERNVFPTFFSIEMSEGSVIDRMIANEAQINLMKMRNPNKYFNDNEWARYSKALGVLENMKMDIRNEKKVNEMRSAVRKNKKQHPDCRHVVYIDFLTMMKSTNEHSNKHLEIEEIVSDLKQLARDYQVPVVLLAQLSRGVELRNDKHPVLADLRESGSIEQTADIVGFLYRENYYNLDTDIKTTDLTIAKNRNGAVGKVDFIFDKETNTFKENDF